MSGKVLRAAVVVRDMLVEAITEKAEVALPQASLERWVSTWRPNG